MTFLGFCGGLLAVNIKVIRENLPLKMEFSFLIKPRCPFEFLEFKYTYFPRKDKGQCSYG